jgi:hypothetical protein
MRLGVTTADPHSLARRVHGTLRCVRVIRLPKGWQGGPGFRPEKLLTG